MEIWTECQQRLLNPTQGLKSLDEKRVEDVYEPRDK